MGKVVEEVASNHPHQCLFWPGSHPWTRLDTVRDEPSRIRTREKKTPWLCSMIFFQGVTCFKWLKAPTRQVLSSKVPSVHEVSSCSLFESLRSMFPLRNKTMCVEKFFKIQMFRHLPAKSSYPQLKLYPNVPRLSDVQKTLLTFH